jgi:hypothetical protein
MRRLFKTIGVVGIVALTLAAVAESSAQSISKLELERILCASALSADKSAWDRSPDNAKRVAEAARRGLTCRKLVAQAPSAPPQSTDQQVGPTHAKEWETLPVRIGAFHEAFNRIARGGTTDLLAEPARCGRGACFYQLSDLDGSVASKVIIAAGQPENNASSIELQAPNTLAQNTLAAAVTTAVQIAAPS